MYEYNSRKSGNDIDNIVFLSELLISKLVDNKYRLKIEDRELLLEALGIVLELYKGETK